MFQEAPRTLPTNEVAASGAMEGPQTKEEKIIEFFALLANPGKRTSVLIRHTYLENGGQPAPEQCLDALWQCTRYPYG